MTSIRTVTRTVTVIVEPRPFIVTDKTGMKILRRIVAEGWREAQEKTKLRRDKGERMFVEVKP